jgi:hypothetical protein
MDLARSLADSRSSVKLQVPITMYMRMIIIVSFGFRIIVVIVPNGSSTRVIPLNMVTFLVLLLFHPPIF